MEEKYNFTSIAHNIGQVLTYINLYPINHPVVKQALQNTYEEISYFLNKTGSLSFTESQGVFLINAQQLEIKDAFIKRLAGKFLQLNLNTLELNKGLTIEELTIFISILSQKDKIQGEENIKRYIQENNVKNITLHFFTYQLVHENEKIVKKDGVLDIKDIPPEALEGFIKNIKEGNSDNNSLYQAIIHSVEALFECINKTIKTDTSIEELTKILWIIGDYLVDEINTVKQEEINRKLLEDLKQRLLKLWEIKESKQAWINETQKTFTAITATIEIKGLLLRYEKDKRAIENVMVKLTAILQNIPKESSIYLKTMEEIKRIGIPKIEILP